VGGKYPVKLNDEAQWAWRVALPGKGCSTPIVWGDHIVLTAPVEGKDALLAFDWNGRKRWQVVLGREKPGKHRNGSGSNSSAVTDGTAFFAFFKSKTLAAVDFKGKVLWQKDLSSYGRDSLYWDFGTSPVLTQKHVVMALMREGNSWLLAFDKRTGELAWKAARNYKTPRECDHSYATPLVTKQGGREALLVWGAERLTAHDAATAVVPYGRGSKLAGIKLNGKGDVTASHRAWETGASSFVPTPAAHDGRVYTVRDRGEVLCTNPKTGETIWKGQFPKNRASYYSSPSIGDGKIYSAREDGTVFVAQIDGGFKLLSENDMGERIIASPVPVNSMLLLRGEKHLFCIKGK
jgi:outer membrane protein assembly factor BamB